MDAFETVMAGLLAQKGYWVAQGFKVELTKEEKVRIGRKSSPRWEIDIVAYSGARNELLAVECKSYLDSPGVDFTDLTEVGNTKSRYKLFTDPVLYEVVMRRLQLQMHTLGLIPKDATVRLALAVGKFKSVNSQSATEELFRQKDWTLFGPGWIRDELRSASAAGYFDSVTHVVSKLIHRTTRNEN